MIIGLGGNKQSGKDTTADILCEEWGFHKIAFAVDLKLMCQEIFWVPPEYMEDQALKEAPFETPIILDHHHTADIWKWVKYKRNIATPYGALFMMDKYVGKKISSPRRLMQVVGTEIIRDILDPLYHVKIVKQMITDNKWERVVISDMRLPNERKFVKDSSGILVLLDCPQAISTLDSHRSETSLGDRGDYDYVISNDMSKGIDHLRGEVAKMQRRFTPPVF